MRLSSLTLCMLVLPCLSLAAKPPSTEITQPRAVACDLQSVVHDWDFEFSDHGFSFVDCDNGGSDAWEYGSTTLIEGASGSVWGTGLDSNYLDQIGQGLLSPPFLVTSESSLLEVVHYFDIESGFDGCNVSAGIWPNGTVLTPMGGYTIPVISESESYYAWCVDQEPGWTGSSGGWVVDCFDLSGFLGQEITLEFDFGSDASVTSAGWYLAQVRVGSDEPQTGACCDPSTGDCQIVLEEVCLETGGVWHLEWTVCDPNPCPPPSPWEPRILVGDWLGAEPWHDWAAYDESEGLPLNLIVPPPLSSEITQVEFYVFDEEAQTWDYLGQDDDGSQPSFDTVGDGVAVGDGWSIIATLPVPIPQPAVQIRAVAWTGSGEPHEYFTERTLDLAPPTLVTTNIEDFMVLEDNVLDLVLEPNGAVIESVIVFVEAKLDTFFKGIPGIDQHLVSESHCSPTSVAQCFRYFEQANGDNTLTGGLSDLDLVAGLGSDMFTDPFGGGTTLFNWIAGTRNWIEDHGDDYSLRYFVHFDGTGTSTWTAADWRRMRNELERCQDVLLGVYWDGGGGHSITLDAIVNDPLENGRIRIGFKDPWTGQEEWGELDPANGRIENMTGSGGGGGATIVVTLVASPIEPMIDWGPSQYVFRGPVPDPPEATPINVPIFAGRYFVEVVIVNDSGHAHREIGIVEYAPSSDQPFDLDQGPDLLSLGIPRPNPFVDTTTISYAVPSAVRATLAIYDVAGRRLRVLVNGPVQPGVHQAVWDGRDDRGRAVASGIYYARLSSAGVEHTRRLVLTR